MSQHDYVLANAAGAAFRADANNALAATVSQNSGATEPTTTYAYMPWFDTTNGILKFRNASNTGWVIDDLNSARGSVAMHATTMDLWAEPKIVDGTGSSVTITDISDAPQAGAVRILYPIAGTTITDNATFDVDGGANYTTSAGDALIFEAVTTSTFKVHIIKADGTSVVRSNIGLTAAVATTSGTSFDFTSISSSAKRITVLQKGTSTNGTSAIQYQLGSGSITTSGYGSSAAQVGGSTASSTTAFVTGPVRSAGDVTSGAAVFELQDESTNTWICHGSLAFTNGAGMLVFGGDVTLSGTLDRIRVTADGVNTFDAGSVSISVET